MSDKRAVLLLLVACVLGLGLHVWRGEIGRTLDDPGCVSVAAAPVPQPALDANVPPAGPPVEIAGVIKSGDILAQALRRRGLSAPLADRIIDSLTEIFDPRKARPGDVFKVVLDTEMSLLGFQYDRATGESYRVEPIGARLASSILPDRLVRHVIKREGVVRRSLYEAVRDVGGSAEEVDQFASICSGSIDFFTETRAGDRFTYIVEGFYDGQRLKKIGRLLLAEYVSVSESEAASPKTIAGVYYQAAGAKRGGYYAPDGTSLERAFLRAPLSYSRITSRFSSSRMHPILKERRPHLGVDFGAPSGTPVAAVADGIVTLAAWHGGMGKCVKVKHAGGITTAYGHLSRFAPAVRSGRRVSQGDVIGFVGSTGYATGPHLHYDIEKNGVHVDPLRFESAGGPPLSTVERPAFEVARDRLRELLVALPAGVPTVEGAAMTAALARAPGPPRS